MDNSMKLHLESQASEWQFKDEGNANLLLSYCSPGSSPFRGCLLRMAKIEANAGAGTAPKPPSYDARDIMEYRTKVITPLLGDLVAPPVLIEVGFDFLQAIAHSPAIQIARKPQRRAKNVDTSQRWALLEVDHTLPFGIPPVQPATAHGSVSAPTGVHVVTFEIKPKWGFKRAIGSEAAKYISKAHIGAKVATCRYCMHRVLKDSAQPHRASPDISGSVEAGTIQHSAIYLGDDQLP
ncbi:hypothetical protein M427DRAFT_75029 [Gonapodya prolifera JEL478]|uniref:Inositol-pentakisphosphate 2-kinase n=1 Tax=Gonapodya prolifera (strain JEL478) TaxID=1344416 RepID=A0A138ZZE7_GONPJ|nr:hypothetical protein M427DRAFT_75029 [Gonapodya prolifera JEL478]|eukprot:KXS09788.1 hypothetical protein M427DRAFT_75029 [Gonapodya prolifera JEL478]